MKTTDLYLPLDKDYPYLKNMQSGVDKVNRAVYFHDQLECTCRFWTSFFQEYGWSGLDKFLTDAHFKLYGAVPDGMDPSVTRNKILKDLSYKAGVALAQGHCLDDLFDQKALSLYMGSTLDTREVLLSFYLTREAAPIFELSLLPLLNATRLPALLYVICSGDFRLANNPLLDEMILSSREEMLQGLSDLINNEALKNSTRESFFARVYSNRYSMRSESQYMENNNTWRDVVNVYSRILGEMPCDERLCILDQHPFIAHEIIGLIHKFERMENKNILSDEAALISKIFTSNPGIYFQGLFVDALIKRIERMTASDLWSQDLFEEFMRTLNQNNFPLTQWVVSSLLDSDARHVPMRPFEVSVMSKEEAITDLVGVCLFAERNDMPLSFNMTRHTKKLLLEYTLKIQDRCDLDKAACRFSKEYGADEVYAILDKYCRDGFFAAKVKKPGLLRDNLSQQLGL